MCIWISEYNFKLVVVMRVFISFVLLNLLAGCLGNSSSTLPVLSVFNQQPKSELLRDVSFFRGNINVGARGDACIDSSSLKKGLDGAFALIADCDALQGDAIGQGAVVTLSALPKGQANALPTASEIQSASNADLVETRTSDDRIFVELAGAHPFATGASNYWRAATIVNGHLVSLAAFNSADGHNTLNTMIDRISSDSQDDVIENAEFANDKGIQATDKPKGLRGLLNGLFPNQS